MTVAQHDRPAPAPGSGALRTLARPDRRWPLVAVALTTSTGHRSDPAGRPGRAHLGEHLMMRQRPAGGDLDLFDWVTRSGGIANANTYPEHTAVTLLLPPHAVTEAVDRFTAMAGTVEAGPGVIGAEVGKIQDEIRALGPERGFPWGIAEAMLYDGPAELLDGHGDPERLGRADPDELLDDVRRGLDPAGAVLSLAGDLGPNPPHNGPAPRPCPPPVRPDQVSSSGTVRHDVRRPGPDALLHAFPMPSLAVAPDAHLATAVLTAVVAQRLNADGTAPMSFRAGRAGMPFTVAQRDIALAVLRTTTGHAAAAHRLDSCLAALAVDGPDTREVARAVHEIHRALLERLDTPEGYATLAGRLAVLAPTLTGPDDLLERLIGVSPATVCAAAAALGTGPRAEIRLTGDPV